MYTDRIEFNGFRFYTYEGRKYYTPHRADSLRGAESSLHREIWKAANGPIPAGHDVHHKCGYGNVLSNLECLPESEHDERHRELSKMISVVVYAG